MATTAAQTAAVGSVDAGPAQSGVEAPRDRFLDLLRLASLAVVVAGHWLVLIPTVDRGVISGTLLYDVEPAFWPLTWAFDVLPLFFFVGGAVNYLSYTRPRRSPGGGAFRVRRLRRLLQPTFVFLGAWAVVEIVLRLLQPGIGGFPPGMRLGHMTPFATLWFLGVYLVVVLLAPVTIRLHVRLGARVPAALLLAVALVDAAALGTGHPQVLAINVLLVWMLPHQLGYFYADGRLERLGATRIAVGGAAALAGAAVLSALPWYGWNMLDNGVTVLGITTPTLPYAMTGLGIVAAALLVRPALAGLLRRPAIWRLVARANPAVMTVYLWHMTAYFAVVAGLAATGVPLPAGPTATWWLERPLFLVLPAAALVPLVIAFSRFETGARRRLSGRAAVRARTGD